MGGVVAAPMVAELALAAWLWWAGGGTLAAVALALVGLVWATTFGGAVPLHRRLARAPDPAAVATLLRLNWGRTLAWTARTGLLGWLAAGSQ